MGTKLSIDLIFSFMIMTIHVRVYNSGFNKSKEGVKITMARIAWATTNGGSYQETQSAVR
jgi:hypothetical protein